VLYLERLHLELYYVLFVIASVRRPFVSERKDCPPVARRFLTLHLQVLPGAVRVLLPLVGEAQPLLELVLLVRLRRLRLRRPPPHWCCHCLRHLPRLLLCHLRLARRIVLARIRSCTLHTCYATIRCAPAGP